MIWTTRWPTTVDFQGDFLLLPDRLSSRELVEGEAARVEQEYAALELQLECKTSDWHSVGPLLVKWNWDGNPANRLMASVTGDPSLMRSLHPSYRGVLTGRDWRGTHYYLSDLNYVDYIEEQRPEYGPRLLFSVKGFRAWSYKYHSDGKPDHFSGRFILPSDPIWDYFGCSFQMDGTIRDPIERLDIEIDGVSCTLGAHHVSRRHGKHLDQTLMPALEFSTRPNGEREESSVKGDQSSELGFLKQLETGVTEFLMLCSLLARHPLRSEGCVLTSYASDAKPESRYACRTLEYADTGKHATTPGSSRSASDLHLRGSEIDVFLKSAMRTLRNLRKRTRKRKMLLTALIFYNNGLSSINSEHRFLCFCMAIESLVNFHLEDWRSQWSTTKAKRSEVSKLVKAAIGRAAKNSHLNPLAHREALEKVGELFRPRIRTVLSDIVLHYNVEIRDIFATRESPTHRQIHFSYLSTRNNLVHRGKVPESHKFFDTILRTRIFLERLLFRVLGYANRHSFPYHITPPKPPEQWPPW